MIFFKNFVLTFLLFLLSIFFIFNYYSSFFFCLNYFSFYKFFSFLDFFFHFNFDNFLMFLMICFVTLFVMMFSEIYMESYNVKKFFTFLFFFFLSMTVLIFSSSNMSIIFSWDLLGLSSVFLIKFYPNEISSFNSLFTMIFNRLGDFFLLMSMIFILTNNCKFLFFLDNSMFLFFFFFFFFFCIMTKSAQFPMSTWLPLAMSAPTPISTMVHSSTLVTVGIIFFFKYNDLFFFSNFFFIFYCMSSITFIAGGLMACYEMDFKKIVAFSTMSQISMIMFFMSFNLKIFSIMHMMFHAYFKSFLFGCSGMLFFSFFMNQNKFFISVKNFNKKMSLFMIFNLYMMSGFIYSMSFFSKDFLFEWSYSNLNLTFFFLIILNGTIFTVMYCKILILSSMNFLSMYSCYFYKKDNNIYNWYYMYSFLFLFSLMYIYFSFFNYFYLEDSIMLNLFMIFLIFIFFKKNFFMFYLVYANLFFNYYLNLMNLIFNFFFFLTLDQEFFFKSYYIMSFNYDLFKSKFFNFLEIFIKNLASFF
nr:NADH dehydrogenase subunit 5 [Nothopoda sp.]